MAKIVILGFCTGHIFLLINKANLCWLINFFYSWKSDLNKNQIWNFWHFDILLSKFSRVFSGHTFHIETNVIILDWQNLSLLTSSLLMNIVQCLVKTRLNRVQSLTARVWMVPTCRLGKRTEKNIKKTE